MARAFQRGERGPMRLSPDGTAEWKQAGVAIQPSLRDWAVFLRCPGVETLVITQIYDELILAALISVRPSFRGGWARWKTPGDGEDRRLNFFFITP